MNVIKKIINNLYITIITIIVLFLFFGYLIDKTYFSTIRIIILLLFGFLLLFVLQLLSKKIKKIKTVDTIFIIGLFLGIIFCFILNHYFCAYPSSDYKAVYEIARDIAWQKPLSNYGASYLSTYPWNYSLVVTFLSVFKLFGTDLITLFIMNLIVTIIGVIFIYLTMRKISSLSTTFVLSIFLLLYLPIYIYSLTPYTHTFSFMFISISLYIYTLIKDNFNIKNVLLLSIIISIGSLYKITVFIFGIALTIELVLKKKYNLAFIPLLSFLIIQKIFFYFIDLSNICYIKTSEAKTSILHYFYLGSNPNTSGQYSDQDAHLAYEYALASNSERNSMYIKAIKERFQQMGFLGTINLYINKIQVTWCDGLYQATDNITKLMVNDNAVNRFFFMGKGYGFLKNITQLLHLTLFTSVLYNSKTNKTNNIAVKLVAIGMFFYLLLFECGSRYVFQFLPVLFYLASCNLKETIN